MPAMTSQRHPAEDGGRCGNEEHALNTEHFACEDCSDRVGNISSQASMQEVRNAMDSQFIENVTRSPHSQALGNGLDKVTLISHFELMLANRPYVLCTFLLMGIYASIALGVSSIWGPYGQQTATHFRFTALELSGGQRAAEPWIIEFGVLRGGCLEHLVNATTSGASMTMHSKHGQPITHDGWWIRSREDDGRHPVRFTLEASDDGVQWTVQGGSSWLVGNSGQVYAGTGKLSVALGRGEVVRLHHDEGWPWILRQTYFVFLCAALSFAFGIALVQRRREAVQIVYKILFVNTCNLFAVSIGYLLTSRTVGVQRALRPLLFAVATVWAPVSIDALHLPPVFSLLVCGILILLGRIVEAAQLEMFSLLQTELPYFPLILISLCSVMIAHRQWKALTARRLVWDDERVLDGKWAAIRAEESSRMQLLALRGRTEELQARVCGVRRHLNHKFHHSVPRIPQAASDHDQPIRSVLTTVECCGSRAELASDSPVESLDQLYAQAAVVRPLLRDKVMTWARESQSWLTLPRAGRAGEAEVVRWQEASRDPRWGGEDGMPCKAREKAREKALQCYLGDVSRLLDISRHRIVFESVSALLACLDSIADDKDVQLLYVRNAMVAEHGAVATAGYRDVKLNLCLRTKLTRQLGVDGHVCEVLLVLRDMMAAQTPASHERYVQLRKLRQSDLLSLESLHYRWRAWQHRMGFSRTQSVSLIHSSDDNPQRLAQRTRARFRQPTSNHPSVFSRVISASTSTDNGASIPTDAISPGQLSRATSTDPAEVDELEADFVAALPEFRRTTCLPGWFLESKVSEVEGALSSADTDSLLFTSRPLLASMTRTRWQLAILLLGFALAVVGVVNQHSLTVVNRGVDFRRYRFTPLELRGGATTGIASPHIDSFRLLHDKCPVSSSSSDEDDESTVMVDGAAMIVALEGPSAPHTNGWELITSRDGDASMDPIRFKLEGSTFTQTEEEEMGEDDASRKQVWEQVTGLARTHDARGSVISYEVLTLDTPTERGASVVLDLRMPVQTHLTHGAVDIIGSALLLSAAVLGRCERPSTARDSIVLAVFVLGLMSLAAGIMWWVEGAVENAVYWTVYSLPPLLSAFLLGFHESLLIASSFWAGVALVVWDAVAGAVLFKQEASALATDPNITGLLMIGFGVIARLYRLRSESQCKRLIARDKAKYDELWQRLMSDSATARQLHLIPHVASTMIDPGKAQPRQLSLSAPVKQQLKSMRWWQQGRGDETRTWEGFVRQDVRQDANLVSPSDGNPVVDSDGRSDSVENGSSAEMAGGGGGGGGDGGGGGGRGGEGGGGGGIVRSSGKVSIVGTIVHVSGFNNKTWWDQCEDCGQVLRPRPAVPSLPSHPATPALDTFPHTGSDDSEMVRPRSTPIALDDGIASESTQSSAGFHVVAGSHTPPRNALPLRLPARLSDVEDEEDEEAGGAHQGRLATHDTRRAEEGLRPAKMSSGDGQRDVEMAGDELTTSNVRRSSFQRPADGLVDVSSPLTSLDQLYTQAARLDPMLRSKVQGWALASRGMFPLRGDREEAETDAHQFVLWDEAVRDPAKQAAVKWGQIKSPDRAVEKLLRSYHQDVSRLLDVCRQQIVFRSAADMMACLLAIADDQDVMVVRVKNRMHPDYNSAATAGYRDLALNVRVVTEEAMLLGLAGHVCEVQLQLQEFAELRNSEGHKRYVRYRNFRAE